MSSLQRPRTPHFGTGRLPIAEVDTSDPSALREAIVTAQVKAQLDAQAALNVHTAAADPHTGYQLESQKDTATGYAGLDGAGLLPTALLPPITPGLRVLTETHAAATFTDGGGAVGTKVMTGSIPVGAVLLGSKVLVPAGFAGDVSCVLTIGDGSDVDRYNTGTPSIFTTAANGIETGEPSGARLLTAANQPTLTITSAADITPVIAGGGSVTVSLLYAVLA